MPVALNQVAHAELPTTKTASGKASREARAHRLKRLRKVSGLSRKAFSERYQISQGTLQNWETARFGGLTEKGARSVIEALQQEGIICSFEWLMYGAGSPPDLTLNSHQSFQAPTHEPTPAHPHAMEKELENFRRLYPNTLDMVVTDDSMEPYLASGDLVAGTAIERVDNALDRVCIVDTAEGARLCRYLQEDQQPGTYRLVCLNMLTRHHVPVLYNVRIKRVAPVVWSRCADPAS